MLCTHCSVMMMGLMAVPTALMWTLLRLALPAHVRLLQVESGRQAAGQALAAISSHNDVPQAPRHPPLTAWPSPLLLAPMKLLRVSPMVACVQHKPRPGVRLCKPSTCALSSTFAACWSAEHDREFCGSRPSSLLLQGQIYLPHPAWLRPPLVAYVRQQNVSVCDPCVKLCPAVIQLQQACLVRPSVEPAARLFCGRGCCRQLQWGP